jgi:hypothetical protein
MRKILFFIIGMILLVGNANATVGWNKSIPATSENPQAISPDVIENNTAVDLMLQNYRDGGVYVKLISTSEIDIGPGGVMLSNSGGSVRLMVANSSLTAMSSANIDTGSISPSSTYYIYAYASSTTATTFSIIYSASSSSPTGITYYQQIGKFTTNGSSNFASASSNINPQIGFGSWTSPTQNSPLQAATDLICTAGFTSPTNSGDHSGNIMTDSGTNPTTARCHATRDGSTYIATSCSTPVKKGDYVKTDISDFDFYYCIPWGT